jgi:tetratricopeptide (TPR) repeat protein
MNMLCLCLVIAVSPAAVADDPAIKVGEMVVVKVPRTKLQEGEKAVEAGKAFHPFRVDKVQEGWLWLTSQNRRGWVRASEVLPLAGSKANDYFTATIRDEPQNAYAHYIRGNLELIKGDRDGARKDLDETIKLDPKEPEYYISRAAALGAAKDLQGALRDLDEAVKLAPESASVHVQRALCETSLNKIDLALADLEKATKLEPNNVDILMLLGQTQEQKGQADRAIATYDLAAKHAPNNPVVLSARALCRLDKGDVDRALADLDQAIKLDPKVPQTYFQRGRVYVLKRDYDRALADFDRAIVLAPTLAFLYVERGETWQDKSDLTRAIADFDKAIGLDHTSSIAFAKRGYAYELKGDYERARKDFDVAVGHDPQDPWAQNSRAWFLATCPDPKFRNGAEALKSASIASEQTASKDPEYLDTLAAAHAETGDFDAAVRVEQKAIELVPASEKSARDEYQARLALYRKKTPYRDSKSALR